MQTPGERFILPLNKIMFQGINVAPFWLAACNLIKHAESRCVLELGPVNLDHQLSESPS